MSEAEVAPRAQRAVVDAEDYLRSMAAEIPKAKKGAAEGLEGKLQRYRADFEMLRRDLDGARQRATRSALLAESAGAPRDERSQRAHESMMRATQSLEESRRIVAETEEIGEATMGDLRGQREQLINAQERVDETHQFTGEAQRLLRSMGRRECQHKCVLVFIILVLMTANILTLYYLFICKNGCKKKH